VGLAPWAVALANGKRSTVATTAVAHEFVTDSRS